MKNKIKKSKIAWIQHENIMLSGRSPSQRIKYYTNPFT
jgi:hypothetical protein